VSEVRQEGSVFRGIAAIVAGIVVNILLSVATDRLIYAAGLATAGQRMPDSMLAVAAIYRIVFSVLSSYLIAALAGRRPMLYAMVAGTLGFLVSIAGAVSTWNQVEKFGPRWYSLSLVVTALPTAWLGAKLYLSRRAKAVAPEAPQS
jgi:hypothetical protein